MRFVASVATCFLVLGALTGCSASQGGSSDCTPLAQSGSAVDAVNVKGDFGTLPQVSFKTPLNTDQTQRKILTAGDGNIAYPGTTVSYEIAIFDASNGKEIGKTSYDGSQLQTMSLSTDSMLYGVEATIECAAAGSQIVSVVSPKDLLDLNGNPVAGLDADSSVVLVIDLVAVAKSRADGKPQPEVEGMPKVKLSETGEPTITVPKTDAPKSLEIAVLKKGDGETVKEGATVTVHYKGVVWSTGKQFDSSWGAAPATFSLEGLVSGFSEALVGQTVGSQILAVLPPDKAYGDQSVGSIPPGSTLVFVVDILSTQ